LGLVDLLGALRWHFLGTGFQRSYAQAVCSLHSDPPKLVLLFMVLLFGR